MELVVVTWLGLKSWVQIERAKGNTAIYTKRWRGKKKKKKVVAGFGAEDVGGRK